MNGTAIPVPQTQAARSAPRHSILDLAPLELECMSVLWMLGEGTVRDVHIQLAQTRRRAYTTIMTIMDRLARKGMVTRLKAGRAYRYRPQLSAEEARLRAVERLIAGFFQGSVAALAAQIAQLQESSHASAAKNAASASASASSQSSS
jgi:predicted transcriptional regulator